MSDGSDLTASSAMASLIRLNEASEEYFLVLDNYFTLLRWKRSPQFAIATGMMIDKIRNREYAIPLAPFAEYTD